MRDSGLPGLRIREKGGVFFLSGEDEFRKEEAARALVSWHLDPATRDFNFDPLWGSEVSVETLASILSTPPMMAEWRVVILREVEALANSPRARETLLEMARQPPPGLALILLGTIPKGSSAKLYQDLKRLARSVEFPAISPNDVPGWLLEWAASRYGREMTLDAARALGAAVGTNLGILAQEVEKLSSLVPEGEPITVEAVRSAGTHIPAVDYWAWMDQVGGRKTWQAMEGLETLMAQGESGVRLTNGLATHLLRVGTARIGGAKDLDATLPPQQKFLAKRLLEQSGLWTVGELEDALLGLLRADRLLKSSGLPEDHILEEWILGLVAREKGSAS